MAKAKQMSMTAKLGLAALFSALALPAAPLLAQADAAKPTPAAARAADTPADAKRIQHGREIFSSWGCTGCHSLADAKSGGDVGPALDGAGLTYDFVLSRVTNGQGAMPSFGGQLTNDEITDLAYYITQVAKK